MNVKEVAKFFSGFAPCQVLVHGALTATGTQFALFGITYDRGLNTTAVFVWSITLILLVYYAWVRR